MNGLAFYLSPWSPMLWGLMLRPDVAGLRRLVAGLADSFVFVRPN